MFSKRFFDTVSQFFSNLKILNYPPNENDLIINE